MWTEMQKSDHSKNLLVFKVLWWANTPKSSEDAHNSNAHTRTHTYKGTVPLGGIHLMVSTAEPLTSLV